MAVFDELTVQENRDRSHIPGDCGLPADTAFVRSSIYSGRNNMRKNVGEQAGAAG